MNIKNCEDEAIHLIESVQSFGYLLAVDPVTGLIRVMSENIADIFSMPVQPEETLMSDLVEMPENSVEILAELFSRAKSLGRRHSY